MMKGGMRLTKVSEANLIVIADFPVPPPPRITILASKGFLQSGGTWPLVALQRDEAERTKDMGEEGTYLSEPNADW